MSAARGDRDLTAGQTIVSIGAIGVGISLGIILMTSAPGPLRLVLGAVTLAGALVWLVVYLTAPARADRRRRRAAWADVTAGTRALYGEAGDPE